MMKFDILTLFPEIFPGVLETSILGRAVEKQLLSFRYTNIRDYSKNKHKKVDDYPYGGGCGMIMQAQPIYDAYTDITKTCSEKPLTLVLSPRGRTFNQEIAKEIAENEHVVLICGHYEGIDQRLIDEIADYEISVGDFVLTGGELGAMIVCDAVSRLIPGVLAAEESFTGESHFNGLLEYPQYTRPPIWNEHVVPQVLLDGNQQLIDAWRTEQALAKTEIVRPDLFEKSNGTVYHSRNEREKSRFALISFASEDCRSEVYKLRRKYARKLKNSGFAFNEVESVLTDFAELYNCLEKQKNPVVLIADNAEALENVKFSLPALVVSDTQNAGSLYPFFTTANLKTITETVLNFLSIVKTVEKYGKN